MDKPLIEPETQMRMVGRTTSLEEANRLAEQYGMQGFKTQIIKKKQGEIALYEVWVSKKPDIFHMQQNTRHQTRDPKHKTLLAHLI